MFFSFLQWLFIALLILYLFLCLFGDKAKTVAAILIAAAVICQVSFHTFSYFRWLGYPSPAEFVMNYLEDCCMLCNVQKRYRIRFEYDTADQTVIHIGKNRGSVSWIYIDVCWLA